MTHKPINTPNKTTIKAMRDAESGKTRKAKSIDQLFKALLKHSKK